MYIRNFTQRTITPLAYTVFRTLKAHSCRSDGVNTASITRHYISTGIIIPDMGIGYQYPLLLGYRLSVFKTQLKIQEQRTLVKYFL